MVCEVTCWLAVVDEFMHFGEGAVSGFDHSGQARPTLGHCHDEVSSASHPCFYLVATHHPVLAGPWPSSYLPIHPKSPSWWWLLFSKLILSSSGQGVGVWVPSIPLPNYSPPTLKKILPILGSCHPVSPSSCTLCSADFPITWDTSRSQYLIPLSRNGTSQYFSRGRG